MRKKLLFSVTFFCFTAMVLQLNAQNWTQTGSTIYGDYSKASNTGKAVATNSDGSRIVVSSPGAYTNTIYDNSVRVYKWNTNTNDWDLETTWFGPNYDGTSYTGFGWDLDMSDDGGRVAVFSPVKDRVHVFTLNTSNNTWYYNSYIQLANTSYSNVALSGDGNYIAVRNDDYNNPRAEVFYYTGSSWAQRGSDIAASTGEDYDISMNDDGSRFTVSLLDGSNYVVRTYYWTGSNWSQLGGDIVGSTWEFGRALSMSDDGNRIAVGSTHELSDRGAIRVYEYSSGSWSQVFYKDLTYNSGYYFGKSVSISDDGRRIAAISEGNSSYNGEVRLYENTSGSTWEQVGQTHYYPVSYQLNSIDISGNGEDIIIGCPYYNTWQGIAVTYGPLVYPTDQANPITFSNIQSDRMTLNWTNGDGKFRIAWMKVGSEGNISMTQNANYNASSTFGSGDYIWEGSDLWRCVYSGSGSSVTVTNLQPNTTYQCQVFEFNGTFPYYKLYLNTTAFGNPASQTTASTTPTVSTTAVSSITATTASSGGNVSSEGGLSVTARGVVWNTTELPTVDTYDGITSDGTGTGSFTSSLTNLLGNTTYYVRAFATNSDGTAYGTQRSFSTTDYTEITWDGSEDSDWNTADNWDLSTVPNSNHNVTIPETDNDPVVGSSGSASCTNLTINENVTLTVNAGGTLITNGTITNNGTVNIKQSLTEDGHWHFISIPNNATTGNTFLDMYLQEWIEGDGAETGWQDVTDPETSLTPAKGYSLWMDDGAKMDFTYTGTPNNGDQSIAITATGTGTNKWMNFVGNPYPSYLDWDKVTGYGSKYTWNGTAYLSYNQTGSYGEGSQYVAPMEGFFIYTASATDFDLNNSMRSHLPSAKKDGKARLNNGLVVSASNGNYSDKLWIVVDDNAMESFELERDAWKLLSGTHGISQLWSVCPEGNLSIDARPETETIQLGFANNQAGIYTISLNEIADITNAILEDTKTATFHDLLQGDYEFMWELSDDEMRFKLHLKAVNIEETPSGESNILIYAANNQFFIKGAESGEIMVSDVMGRVVLRQEINGDETISIPANLQTGVYVVMVRNGEKVRTEKIFIK